MKFFYITPLILQKLIWLQIRLILWFFIGLEVRGLKNLKKIKGNAIFATNHSSEIDPILVPASLPFFSRFSPIFFVTLLQNEYKNSGWRQAFYGKTFFKLWGGHPAYLGLKNYEKSLVHHIELLKDGKNLCVFPEGGIARESSSAGVSTSSSSNNGALQPARGGIGYLAETTGKPIIPVAITGVYNMSNSDFFLRRRKVVVNFGKPIYKEELDESSGGQREIIHRNVYSQGNIYKKEAEYVMTKIGEIMESN